MPSKHKRLPCSSPILAVLGYGVAAGLGWWCGRPVVVELWSAVHRDGAAVLEWPLDRLVVTVACCLLVLATAILLVSVALTVVIGLLTLRIPALHAIEQLTGPRWWRTAVLTLFGVSLLVSGPAAIAEDAGPGGQSVREDSSASPLAGLPYPDLPASGRYVRTPLAVSPDGAVIVRPGDSLWLIAADRLGVGSEDAAVAREVSSLYAANRLAIGDDPDFILPGTRLITTRRHR